MDNFNDAQVEPEVFGGAATRDDQSIVVFHVIADDHEDGFLRHGGLRNSKRITNIQMPAKRSPLHESRITSACGVAGQGCKGAALPGPPTCCRRGMRWSTGGMPGNGAWGSH